MNESAKKIYESGGLVIAREAYGAYSIHHLRGTYKAQHHDPILKALRESPKTAVLATSEATGFDIAFCRELVKLSRDFAARTKGLLLLSPSPKIIEFIAILGADSAFQVIHHKSDLSEKPEEVGTKVIQADSLMDIIKKEIKGNPAWHLCDRDFRWVCPFCGALQEHIYVQNYAHVTQETLDSIYEHLKNFCPPYTFGGGVPLSRERLNEKLSKINMEKYERTAAYTARLRSQVDNLKTHAARSQALEASLAKARQRQNYLLPERAPDIENADIGILYLPAEELSGDFYDFIQLETHRTALVMGDVTGHGIEAGIVMGMAKKVLQIRTREKGDILNAMIHANSDIYPDLGRGTFVTVLLGIYDASTRVLEFARAGHTPPILYNPAREPALQTLDTKGLAMGIDDGTKLKAMLETRKVQLQSGDLVFFYTDGIIEAANPQGEEFDMELLGEFLAQSHALNPDELVANLQFILQDFVGSGNSYEDDITALALKIR
jgi:serine phosphatase RsbU (regulator of sigma subunit)